MNNDSDVQRYVRDELRWEPGISDSSKIAVEVKNGGVTLTGTVSSFFEKWSAERAAKRVAGVKGLLIDLKVEPSSSLERTDADIARAIENALRSDLTVPYERIKVTVQNGWVILEGGVETRLQSTSAEDDVRKLTGVKGVSNSLTLKPSASPAEIKSKIEAALQRYAALDAQTISVEEEGSKVTLCGTVRSWVEREQAEDAAWAAPGVTEVKNHITII